MRNVIREARKRKKLSQLELAKKIGVSYNVVAFAERGVVCTEKTADALSKVLGTRILPVVSERKRKMLTKRFEARRQKLTEKYAQYAAGSGTGNGQPQ